MKYIDNDNRIWYMGEVKELLTRYLNFDIMFELLLLEVISMCNCLVN